MGKVLIFTIFVGDKTRDQQLLNIKKYQGMSHNLYLFEIHPPTAPILSYLCVTILYIR